MYIKTTFTNLLQCQSSEYNIIGSFIIITYLFIAVIISALLAIHPCIFMRAKMKRSSELCKLHKIYILCCYSINNLHIDVCNDVDTEFN